jgi:predicted MFS family arabinose efflux permease
MLGWGTAMVYPTFLAAIAENTNPGDRAKSLGTFRFWRDLGYAFGAILTGLVADAFGIGASIFMIALLTISSSFIIRYRMICVKNSVKLGDWIFQKKI